MGGNYNWKEKNEKKMRREEKKRKTKKTENTRVPEFIENWKLSDGEYFMLCYDRLYCI